MATIPTLEARFIRADEKLRTAIAEMEALRTGVTNAYQNAAFEQGKVQLVPEVTRSLSIAITEAEGALLRFGHAHYKFLETLRAR